MNQRRSACLRENATKIRIRSLSSVSRRNPSKKKASHQEQVKSAQGWRVVAGRRVYFRSRWEANIGRYLQWQKERKEIAEWEHEPQTFWFDGIKRGCVSYLPDFKVTRIDGSHYWIEVKGFMDAKSRTKLNRFSKYFPKEEMRLFDSKWYRKNKKALSSIVPEWEN